MQETTAWCQRAEQFAECAEDEPFACLAVVREGIVLRRQWDRIDPGADARHRLLCLLAEAQVACQQQIAEQIEEGAPPAPARIEHVVRRLVEDDAYLADLLEDHQLPAETVAFAVECFRDDLHWLGTLVALLDGSQGIDFNGRVLLEEEALQRAMESWADEAADGRKRPSATPAHGPSAPLPEELIESARRLQETALGHQAASLLGQPEPDDWRGWFDAWQAAGRLIMRLEGGPVAELEQTLEEYRHRAKTAWRECIEQLPDERRAAVLRKVVEELADTSAEALTFMEDLPLPEAVQSLEILADDTAFCQRVVADYDRRRRSDLRRRLRRRRRALAAELQERRLAQRLEGLLGHTAVAAMERFILLLLVLFLVMLVVEFPLVEYERRHFPGSNVVEATCAWIDLGICLVFLAEFTLKFSLARPRLLYLRRHWITGLVPAIPVGFILYACGEAAAATEAGEWFVLLRALRYLRLPQMARWLRLARPIVRGLRVMAFTMQASDRLVRQVASLLNRNLVLFERAAIKVEQPQYQAHLAALRERFYYRASEVIARLPEASRWRLAQARMADLTTMLAAPRAAQIAPTASTQSSLMREIPLERLIARLLAATPAGISERIGRSVAQSVARWCRALDVFAVRRLPLVRHLVEAGRRPSPYEVTAQVANQIGMALKHGLDRVYWLADLYGTVTAPQLVDSVGDWMVKGTARPARRFLMIGVTFLVVSYLASLIPALQETSRSLERLIGAPLIILGVLCLIPMLTGLWFRQIAGEATDFCSRVAEAQFLTATKQLKRRLARRHHAVLHSRVIAPEMTVGTIPTTLIASGRGPALEDSDGNGQSRGAMAVDSEASPDWFASECPLQTAVEMLFRDYLDGAPFHRSDTKTTTQLLGNLTLVSLRETRLRYDRRRRKQLRRLDLAATRSWIRGPYLWFHFISRSLAQQTARLVCNYNANALPLDRAATADDEEIRRHVGWLADRWETTPERLELPPAIRARFDALSTEAKATAKADAAAEAETVVRASAPTDGHDERTFYGNDFTAVHFLCAEASVEADVQRRYGDLVARLMLRDRRDNIRRVFRTYPLYTLPKQARTFNPLVLYVRHFAGGRVLLLPIKILWYSGVLLYRAVRQLIRFVRDVLDPTTAEMSPVGDADPFEVAVRKIHRMRKPVFLECLRMRADFDPEYLGAVLPGCPNHARGATATPVEGDLEAIDADPGVRHAFRQLAAERRRQVLEFRRVLKWLDCRDLPAESLRAMAIAYTIDFRRARSRLEARARLKRAFDDALAPSNDQPADAPPPRRTLRAWWRRWRNATRFKRLFALPDFAHLNSDQQAVCRRLLYSRRGPLLAALKELTSTDAPIDPIDDARQTLLAVGRDPATWSRQLVVLRAVQTLSVLDLRTYCDLVAELGEYGASEQEETDGCSDTTKGPRLEIRQWEQPS